MGSFTDNPMGIHWTGIVFGLGFVISFGYWTTDFLVVQRVLTAKDLRSAKMAPIIGAAFKMCVPLHRDPARACSAWPCCPMKLVRRSASRGHRRRTATTKCCR